MTDATTQSRRREMIRYFAATMAGLTAVAYYLIGFQLVSVLENTDDQTAFGLIAGTAFLIGAVIILVFDRRLITGLGALAQAFIIFLYFSLAPDREPSFEFWGILIRVIQALLLAALLYLTFAREQAPTSPEEAGTDRVEIGVGEPW